MEVPEVLLSGDHAKIREWRRRAAVEKTRRNRPDLLPTEEGDPRRPGPEDGDGGL
jgi:tRNA (guanine37-N1)-methyltransferase